MAKLLRKALGLFVDFNDEENQTSDADTSTPKSQPLTQQTTFVNTNAGSTQTFQMHNDDLEKFEAHFEELMDQANLPGPDYYEFCKMMEAFEKLVPDENARMVAVYASLSAQGLTRDKLIDSAQKYKDVLDLDKQNFDGALNQKAASDVESKKQRSADLDKKIADNSAQIQRLTKEITDAQIEIEKLKQDIGDGETKLQNNKRGYTLAYQAMINKINIDLRNIQTTIK